MYGYSFDFFSVIFSIIIFVLCVGLPIAFFVFIVKVLYKYLKTKSECKCQQ